MHELSVAQAIVDRIERILAQEKGRDVSRVVLSVGSLSGIDTAALAFAMPVVAADRGWEAVDWDIRPVRAAVRCATCGGESEPEDIFPVCRLCESTDVEIIRGRELLIDSVDIKQ